MVESKHPYTFVYQTINKINGKSYIGVHTTSDLDDGYIGCGVFKTSDAWRPKFHFHRAVRKYGYTSFERYILSFYDTYKEAMEEERFIVDKVWVKQKNNYNTAIGGNGGAIYGLSDEEKKEIYAKVSKSNTGKKRTKEFCERLSNLKTGVPLSDAHKLAMSLNNARYWKGKQRSEDTKRLLSLKHSGKKLSENHKEKMSLAKKGNDFSNNQKSVLVFDINNNFIKEYQSARAAGRELNISHTSIQNNMMGRSKICNGGYVFKYKKEVNFGC